MAATTVTATTKEEAVAMVTAIAKEEAACEEQGEEVFFFLRSPDLNCPFNRTVKIRGDCKKFSCNHPRLANKLIYIYI